MSTTARQLQITYHPSPPDHQKPALYAKGFKSASVDQLQRIAKCISSFVWSPCIWNQGERKEANFLSSDWAVLDFDDGEMTLSQAMEQWQDCVHVIGTTKSHLKEKGGLVCDRFRVALKFSQTITDLKTYRYNMKILLDRFPADKACKDGARFFFPCTQIVSIQGGEESFLEEVNNMVPDHFEKENTAKIEKYKRSLKLPGSLVLRIKTPIVEGKINTTLYGLGKDLAKYGMSLEETFQIVARYVVVDLNKDDYRQGLINGHKSIEKERKKQ